VKRIFSRWLPTIALTPTRKAVLGVAGVALAGAALTGTATSIANAAHSDPVAAAVAKAPASAGAAALPAPNRAVAPAPAQAAAPAPAAAQPTRAAAAPAARAPAAKHAAPKPAPAPPKEKALGYDFRLQPNYYYCGPAATRIALSAVGQLNSFDTLAQQLGTTPAGTASAFDIARVLNAHVGAGVYHTVEIPNQAASQYDIDLMQANIIHAVTNGHAVVANVIGTTVDLLGGVHSYEGGHYLTIVGYGEHGTTVKIADPADTAGDGSYWMSSVNAANWIASRGYAA
jgi:hypothetical protein